MSYFNNLRIRFRWYWGANFRIGFIIIAISLADSERSAAFHARRFSFDDWVTKIIFIIDEEFSNDYRSPDSSLYYLPPLYYLRYVEDV